MNLDDIPFSPPDEPPQSFGAPEPRIPRHRHDWVARWNEAGEEFYRCRRCPTIRDLERARRGRSSRSRGNAREREIAKSLGGQRVGQFGGPADVTVTGLFIVQSKVRKAFPYWMTAELDKLPRTGGLTPLLVVTDAPGPGKRRRSVVVVDLSDWISLHGADGVREEAA